MHHRHQQRQETRGRKEVRTFEGVVEAVQNEGAEGVEIGVENLFVVPFDVRVYRSHELLEVLHFYMKSEVSAQAGKWCVFNLL